MKLLLSSLLLAGWVLVSGYVLWQDQHSLIGTFDPEQRWQQRDTQPIQLPETSAQYNQGSIQLIHVIDPNCRCHRQQQKHQQELQQEFSNVPQKTLSISQAKQLGLSIPAAPLAILLEGDQLVYAGPYSAGPVCGAGNGWVEQLLRGEIQLAGAWLNGESSSCRCLQSV